MNIKTYKNTNDYLSTEKNKNGSEVSFVKSINEIKFNGRNVLIDTPHIGALAVWDNENSKKRYIALDTIIDKNNIPSNLSPLGVVYHISGDMVYIVPTMNYTSKKWTEVYEWRINDNQWNQVSGGSATLRLHTRNSNYASTKYVTLNITYGANLTHEQFAGVLQTAYDDTVGDNLYSFYPETLPNGTTIVRVCWLNYVEHPSNQAQWNGSNLTFANGDEYGVVYNSTLLRKNINVARHTSSFGGTNLGKCIQYYSGSGGQKTTGDVNLTKLEYALNKSVFNPTDNPKTYEMYGGDFEQYISEWMMLKFPCPTMYAQMMTDGAKNTELLWDKTYQKHDGTKAYKYTFAKYAHDYGVTINGVETDLEPGNWHMPSNYEFINFIRNVTYGLPNITKTNCDPVNRTLFKLGYNGLSCSSDYWSGSRYGIGNSWCQYGNAGYLNNYYGLYDSLDAVPVAAFSYK